MTNASCECPVAGMCARRGCVVPGIHWRKCQAGHVEIIDDLYAKRTTPEPLVKVDNVTETRRKGGVTPANSGKKQQTSRSSCAGCSRPGPIARAQSAAAALARFVGDGLKTASPQEQADRRMICAECPLNANGTCSGCGCLLSLKTAARLETCPAGKWHPDLHMMRPIVSPVKNIIMHLLPVASNDVWKWNLEQVAQRQSLFNGKRVLAIATESKINRNQKDVRTVSPEDVIRYCDEIGTAWSEVRVFRNSPTLREVVSFPWLLETVCSGNPNEITFSCHAKGVTHSMDSITVRWAERQYRVCLDDWQTVWRTMERFSMAGSFRRLGQFATPRNNQWHYSGTNYWFRHDDVFSRDWRSIDQRFFGTESWPGRMFKPEECACLFADDACDPYKEKCWIGLQREIDVWEGARQ